jgi:GDP-4-dehydro-6-deoxy-D-mannose reductase
LRVLITGGTGFVGTHLIELLKSKNYSITVFGSGERYRSAPGVEYHELDIRNRKGIRSLVRQVNPNQIFHLAGISAIDASRKDPRLTYEVNVFGAYNVFEAAMSQASPPRILNVSTSQVYAPALGMLSEDSAIGPDNPYAVSKTMAELLVMQYRGTSPGGIVTTRSFNHTGPGQPPNFVVSSIAKQFAEIQSGTRPPRLTVGNIAVRRDFTDVRDVIQAYCALIEKGRTGEVYNVCSGTAISIAEIIKMFEMIVGIKTELEIDPKRVRSNEVQQICGDNKKIQAETGWKRVIPLQRTLEDLLDYWRAEYQSRNPSSSRSRRSL